MAIDLTVYLENKPGTIADVGEALGRAGVNIIGGCGFPAEGRGVMHVLVDDESAARSALEGSGAEIGDARQVVVTDVADRPGELGTIMRRMADAGINVDLLYLTAGGQLVFGPDDVEAAKAALSD